MPTQEELIEMGKKFLAQKEKDKERQKIYAQAAKMLIKAHKPEYDKYVAELSK